MPSILTPDLGLLFWMLVAFLTVFGIVGYYGFSVITKMVEDRKTYIDESLGKAREANEQLAGIQQESENILREARLKQAEILQEAKKTGDALVAEARSRAAAEGTKLLEEARAQIEADKQNALRDIRGVVASLSVEIAGKILSREIATDEAHNAYVDSLLQEADANLHKANC